MVNPARRVGGDERAHAEQLHHSNGKHNVLHRVAFIKMQASLHANDRLSAQTSRHKTTRMAGRRGNRKMRNLRIGNFDCLLDASGNFPEP